VLAVGAEEDSLGGDAVVRRALHSVDYGDLGLLTRSDPAGPFAVRAEDDSLLRDTRVLADLAVHDRILFPGARPHVGEVLAVRA